MLSRRFFDRRWKQIADTSHDITDEFNNAITDENGNAITDA
jgi:hypothetical protein